MAQADSLHRVSKTRCCGIKVPHKSHIFYKDAGVYMGSAIYSCPGWTYANVFEEVREHGGRAMGGTTKSIGEDA
jgi:hypothetical protein